MAAEDKLARKAEGRHQLLAEGARNIHKNLGEGVFLVGKIPLVGPLGQKIYHILAYRSELTVYLYVALTVGNILDYRHVGGRAVCTVGGVGVGDPCKADVKRGVILGGKKGL